MKTIFKKVLVALGLALVVATAFSQPYQISNSAPATVCGNASGYMQVMTGGVTVMKWEVGTFNGTFTIEQTFTTSNSYLNYSLTAPAMKAYRAYCTGASGPSYTNVLIVTANTPVTAGTISSGQPTEYHLVSGVGTLTANGASGGTVGWYKKISGGDWVPQSSGSTLNYSGLTESSTYRTVVTNSSNTCSATGPEFDIRVYKPGVLTVASGVDNSGFAIEGSIVTFNIVGNYLGMQRWEYSKDNGVNWVQVPSGTPFKYVITEVTTTPVKFRALVDQGPFPSTYTNIVEVLSKSYTEANVASNQVSGLNYVKTQQVTVAGITDPAVVDALPSTQKRQTTSYLDGLGRRIQQNISKAGALLENDIIIPSVYGHEGIATTSYLPYASSLNTGSYASNAVTTQAAFYNNGTSDKIEDSAYPFSKIIIEKSPLGLMTEAGSAGAGFQPGQGHARSMAYLVNDLNEVRMFNSDGTSSGFYSPNELAKSEITDEDGKKVQTITDRAGRTILTRHQLDETIGATVVPWLETYYIYNASGDPKYIISPNGVLALLGNGWSFSAIKDQYVHEFVYDQRGRLIEKKVPGQAWIYYGYDRLNRIVLVQDGNIRSANKWFFVKYDRAGRPVMKGLYQNTTHTTRAAIQLNVLDPLYALDTDKHYEDRGTVLHGYTNQSFPTTNTEILSVDYYDTHDFDFNGTNDYTYTVQSLPNENIAAGSFFGKATGSKRLVLGTSTWLYTYVFYDTYGRTIQSRTNNHLSATIDNLVTVVYDFEGKVKTKKVYHNAGSGRVTTVINKFDYDNIGRLLKVYQNNNGAPTDQVVMKIEYNELGQPVDKKLHEVSANTFLQSIDLRYNIRGWLTSINNATLTNDGIINDEAGDFFGIEYLYDKTETGLTSTSDVMYNGNLSAVKWKSLGGSSGASDQSSYKFTYDKSNRLKTSTSQMYNGTAWTKEAGAMNENTTYDGNGNILSLYRNQRKHQISGGLGTYVAENVDNLTYAYSSTLGDQLTKITDATSHASGFDNGGSQNANDYTYDGNGSLLTDANKGISGVVYNAFGKATQITFNDTRKVEYVYDVDGSKLTMKVFATGSGTPTTTTDYIDEFVYENGSLSFFASPGGRVVKNGANLEYQYSIADQQGNTRVLFTSATPAAAVSSANFESSTNTNFPNYTSTNRSPRPEFDKTDPMAGSSTYSQLLTGGYNAQIGVAKSFKVYPGDKVKVDAYAKYQTAGGGPSNLANFASALTNAFGYATAPTGEALKPYNALNSFGGLVAGGTGHSNNSGHPMGFVTILLFDKDYKFLDAAWDQIDGSYSEPAGTVPPAYNPFDLLSKEVTIREEGYAYVYISNESPTSVDIYFDDVVMTHTKTPVIQYNEYYPFGLQASRSWTRDDSKNDFLYNAASELNRSTGWYETFFRNYDPAIGRFTGIDPLATAYSSFSGYHYGYNNPVRFNDPSGAAGIQPGPPDGLESLRSFMQEHGIPGWYDGPQGDGMREAYDVIQEGQAQAYNSNLLARARNGDMDAVREYASQRGDLYTSWTGYAVGYKLPGSDEYTWEIFIDPVNIYTGAQQEGGNVSDRFWFIGNEASAYQFMLAITHITGDEMAGILVTDRSSGKRGVLVLPWTGNTEDSSNPYGYLYRGAIFTDKEGNEYDAHATIHTHPDGDDTRPSRDDNEVARYIGLPAYILTPLFYVQYFPSSDHRGMIFDIIRLNKPISLFPK